LSDAELAAVDDGRVFTGRQALGLKLVDQIGGEQEAIAWMVKNRGVKAGLPVRDWKPDSNLGPFGLFSTSARIAEVFGFGGLARTLDQAANYRDTRLLDGLLSIWQVDPVD